MKAMFYLLAGDTTSSSYRVGYAIGQFFPFILLAGIFIWLVWKNYKRSR